MTIYTPASCIASMASKNIPSTNTKIEFMGFSISIAMAGIYTSTETSLSIASIRVYWIADGIDHTQQFLTQDEHNLDGKAETLFRVMSWIATGQVAVPRLESISYRVQADGNQVLKHPIFGVLSWKAPNPEHPNQVAVYYTEKAVAQEVYRTLKAAGKVALKNWLD